MRYLLCALAAALLFPWGCATAPKKEPPEAKPPEAAKRLPPKEQEALALQTFTEILELTADVPKRQVLAQMQELYWKIIREYPDSYYAKESYWRLIIIHLEDFQPPRIQRAMELYREFLQKYPRHPVRLAIEDTMVRFFYKAKLWKELLEIVNPVVREFVRTGELKGPFFLFLYAEAKRALGELEEAEKGYRHVIGLFPSSTEAKISRRRLKGLKESSSGG